MERMQVTAQPRTAATKGQLKALRKSGAVPGIVYGKKTDPIPVTVDSKDITAILQSPSGVNTLVDLNVDGNKETVMIKELTRDILLADRYLHVDFLRISLRDKLEVQVPITLVGEAVGVKDGGILQQQLREVTLKCLPTSIPESVELDISGLAIGESLTVADLTVPADSEFISEADEVIVSIIAPRVEEEAEAAEEAEDTEAPAEETADAETDTE
ncbi:MAG TPA: 50S ribosomal protein L25/general stress protein Ctc [Firmicutes bacterium]|jgi:large subunit ribosomal protein L25|nr:50S ribosomal protein L25/general stress protein Ctc [Bacillota bacterium]HAA37865.1 50S ribosomal protein L25/general stress protein Ctc [Bacillota bacterium]